jgi:hypothetical protein
LLKLISQNKEMIFMALELVFWGIFTLIGLGAYVFSLVSRSKFLFVISCALLIGSGALLWGFNGLLLEHQVSAISDAGLVSYTDVSLTMSNLGMVILSLVFVAVGVLSILATDFGSGQVDRTHRTYHF